MKQSPFADVNPAVVAIKSYHGSAKDFTLPIADSLQDSVGISMAIITESILAKGWQPQGFEQKENFRIYRYKEMQ
jgi:hypothetical protein